MPDFHQVLRTRRSVRSYVPDTISETEIEKLIDLAILAPSGMNTQPWAFTVVSNTGVLRRLNAIVLQQLRTPEVQDLLQSEGLRETFNNPEYDIFYGAPCLVVISGESKAPSASTDCQLAAENLFLAAHATGLGTCYMGLLLFARESAEVRSLLRIPEGHEIMAAAVVGHPNVRPEGPPLRRPPRIEWVT